MNEQQKQFSELRYGLFVHFGLYSLLARGEWAMNREGVPRDHYRSLADRFRPVHFDADAIAQLAIRSGMRYLVFTTMHHDGFRLYDSELTDFCSTRTTAQRDFTAEVIAACRKHGLKVGLYHSLNNWMDLPDAVDALESPSAYNTFIKNTHNRIRELVTRYNPIDILWYDGWWPYDAKGWQAERMNAMVRGIQPQILLNGRNGLPGDFATPEQHLSIPKPWQPWEACVTLNDNWGYHAGDRNWKSPVEVIKMLIKTAQGRGNLLLNVGPDGNGCIPLESLKIIEAVGKWLKINGECLYGTDLCTLDPYLRGSHRGDWSHHGPFTVRNNALYLIATSEPLGSIVIHGLEAKVQSVTSLGGESLRFSQTEHKVEFQLPLTHSRELPPVYKLECDRIPSLYGTGGMRIPKVEHPRYDPLPSEIDW